MTRRFEMLPFLAAVFIDLFSFGLMYPVIVLLFRELGARHAYSPATLDLLMSLTFSLFPFGMFFGASLLGDVSDALGRRRTLILCLSGLTLAYGLMFLGVAFSALPLLLLGRLFSGLMAGSAPIAQAAMMDRSTPETRGRNMARIVLVNCVALASAPTLGGVLTDVSLSLPMLVTVLLCLGALALVLQASWSGRPQRALQLDWRRPFMNFVHAAQHPKIRWLALSFLLFQLGFAIYYIYELLLMSQTYHLRPSMLGLFSGCLGLGFVIGSTIGYRASARLIPREDRLCALSLLVCGLCILLAAVSGAALQWPLFLLAGVTNAIAYIPTLSLISGAAAADEQGWALGIGSAATALAFFISGFVANAVGLVPLSGIIAIGGLLVLLSALPLSRAAPALAQPLPGRLG